jgi:hypothetical protein
MKITTKIMMDQNHPMPRWKNHVRKITDPIRVAVPDRP